MKSISANNTASMLQLSSSLQLHSKSDAALKVLKGTGAVDVSDAIPLQSKGNSAEEVRDKFTQFVGEAFYGQMFKAMRSTVGKPAYFHGGRAEEAFQGQLDQTMTEQLTKSTASKFAEPMFERQFPHLAESLRSSNDLGQLAQLPRR
jgi:peptidoglycan hydrolase FlgJ